MRVEEIGAMAEVVVEGWLAVGCAWVRLLFIDEIE